MYLVRTNGSSPPSEEEKRQALEIALASKTFARAEQLRTLLQYLCKAEGEGRHKELSEYAIGTEVLGRPESFSPTEDSSVRTRLYELRHKLEKLYALEAQSAPVRIVLPKGTYVPHFDRAPGPDGTATGARDIPAGSGARWASWVLLFAGAAGAAGIGAFVAGLRNQPEGVEPIVREAWGPLAHPDANVLLSVATPLHLTVGPESHKAYGSPTYPAPAEAYPLWRQHRPLAEGAKLGLVFTDNVIGFGTMNAVLSTVHTLRRMGAGYQLLPERVAPISTFRNRNVILFGAPVDSDAVTRSHRSTPLLIDYDEGVKDFVVRDRSTSKTINPRRDDQGQYETVYGLITVLNNRDSERGKLAMVLFSGITSAGTHGAAEYFASPRSLGELQQRFRREGLNGFPSAYQVVVRCTFSNMLLVSYESVEHRVLEK